MRKRIALVAAVAAGGLSLTGCGLDGTAAAHVGQDTVSADDVEFLTRVQCDLLDKTAGNPTSQSLVPDSAEPRQRVRADIVNALVLTEVSEQLSDEEGVEADPSAYRSVMANLKPTLEAIDKADRERFGDLVSGIYRGQLAVYELARRQLASEGVDQPEQSALDERAATLQDDYRASIEVTVNPEYAPDADGIAGAGDGSISVPVSDDAKAATDGTDSAWIAGLPASQKCG